jgi:hypothetical protein
MFKCKHFLFILFYFSETIGSLFQCRSYTEANHTKSKHLVANGGCAWTVGCFFPSNSLEPQDLLQVTPNNRNSSLLIMKDQHHTWTFFFTQMNHFINSLQKNRTTHKLRKGYNCCLSNPDSKVCICLKCGHCSRRGPIFWFFYFRPSTCFFWYFFHKIGVYDLDLT